MKLLVNYHETSAQLQQPFVTVKTQLIYGKRYHIWLGEEYLGVAIWTREYYGTYYESYFESADPTKLFIVYKPDRWEPEE